MGMFIVVFLGFALLFFILWMLVRLSRVFQVCRECNGAAKGWERLNQEDRSAIRRYYREIERRQPDASRIRVCQDCHRVWDDFTGEEDGRLGTFWEYCKVCGRRSVYPMYETFLRRGRDAQGELHPELVETYECLRCQRGPKSKADCDMCDTPRKLFSCPQCMTPYEFQSPEWTKLRFLRPLTRSPLRKRP